MVVVHGQCFCENFRGRVESGHHNLGAWLWPVYLSSLWMLRRLIILALWLHQRASSIWCSLQGHGLHWQIKYVIMHVTWAICIVIKCWHLWQCMVCLTSHACVQLCTHTWCADITCIAMPFCECGSFLLHMHACFHCTAVLVWVIHSFLRAKNI